MDICISGAKYLSKVNFLFPMYLDPFGFLLYFVRQYTINAKKPVYIDIKSLS